MLATGHVVLILVSFCSTFHYYYFFYLPVFELKM